MPMNQTNILAAIWNDIDTYSAAERRIAEFILENQDAMILNQADLAAATATSAPTVSRFCKRLGLKNFREFQTVLYGEIVSMHGSNGPTAEKVSMKDVPGSLSLILTNKIADEQTLLESVSPDSIGEMALTFTQARRVLVAGIGKTIPCAIDAAYKLSLVGIAAESSEIYEKMLSSALTMRTDDVVYIISASGYCPRLLRVALAAHERGAMVLVATGNAGSPIARQADLLLVPANREKAINGTFGYSITHFMLLNEMVYLLIASGTDATSSIEDNQRFQLGKGLALGD